MEDELKGYLERGIAALESLAQDPVIEIETKPPICPHCERINPNVRVHEKEAVGAMAEFVIQAQCLSCNEVFVALPVQWEVAKNVQEASQMVAERTDQRGYS